MPQHFATAYHQCRWNYRDEQDVELVDKKFDDHNIPYDVLWLDIEHMDGKKYFTWDRVLFPNPEEMQKKLATKGRHMVTIMDPHMKRDDSYNLHKEATEKGYYVKDATGKDFDGWCWPGSSSYPDMLNPKIRSWWAEKFSYENYVGSTPSLYIWNDMNEPSVFNGPEVHIIQRGAVHPLIEMLQSPDAQLWEMAAFALGRLAQAGIAHSGAIEPLLKLLESKNAGLQHNAAFALYGLADNEGNVADLIRVGGVQRLQDGEFMVQPTRDCVAKTLKRLEEKIHERVLSHLLYLMRVSKKATQRRVALALAHMCSPANQKTIFVDNNGLQLLLDLLKITNVKQQRDGSKALYKLAIKSSVLSPVDAAPLSPTPQDAA